MDLTAQVSFTTQELFSCVYVCVCVCVCVFGSVFLSDSSLQEVGCDYGIDSNALEDRCGVCLGDGSSCETIYKTFNGGEGFGGF